MQPQTPRIQIARRRRERERARATYVVLTVAMKFLPSNAAFVIPQERPCVKWCEGANKKYETQFTSFRRDARRRNALRTGSGGPAQTRAICQRSERACREPAAFGAMVEQQSDSV